MQKNYKKNFSRRNAENVKYLLENESWAEIHLVNNLNDLYKLSLSKFMYYLESAFPIMNFYKKKLKIN